MNLFAIIVFLFIICKMVQGYHRGMVKEIISFLSLIILCIVVGLLGQGMQSYMKKEFLGVIVVIILFTLLGIAHHLLSIVFFSAKLVSKLPVVHWADKVLGVVVGGLESILLLWTAYVLIEKFGLGTIGEKIIFYTQENTVLSWFYQNNYLAGWLETLTEWLPYSRQ